MEIKRHLKQILNQNQVNKQGLVLTIGNFDGVHLGHAQILNKVKEIARLENLQSGVLTFQPHPIWLFKPQFPRDYHLTSLAQKLKIFQKLHIDQAIILPFNTDLSNLNAANFIEEILVKALNVKHLVIGYDFIFGKNREGNSEILKAAGAKFGFKVTHIDACKNNEQIYSSSLIRNFIKTGQIKAANQALGYSFTISGDVISGQKLAAQIGFPTANLGAKPHIIQPKFGVYKILVHLDNKVKNGIMNFGLKPTIQKSSALQNLAPLYEIHIFDFNAAIYGKKISVELLDFIREEKKFASLDELKKQIALDVEFVKK